MDDSLIPDENEQPSAGAPQAPVIPAPRRPAPAPEPGTEAASPAFEEPAGEAETLEPETPPEVPEAEMPAGSAEAEMPAETPEDALAPADATGGAEPATEIAPEAPAAEDASLDAMVAGLREGEPESDQTAAEGEEAPAETATEGAEGAEGAETAAEGAETAEGAGAAESAGEVPLPIVIAEGEAEEDTRALRRRSAKIPFWVYLGVWLVFAGVQTYLMWPLASEPFTSQPVYGLLVLIATGLVCSGLILGLCVWWFVSAHSEPADRGGLVRAMLLRTAASMTGGVLIWWVALLVLDLRRLGMLG